MLRRLRVSLRGRVTATALLVLAITLIGFDVWLYTSFDSRLTADLARDLRSRASLAVALAPDLDAQEIANRLAAGGVFAEVSRNGSTYLGRPSPPRPGTPPVPPAAPAPAVRPARQIAAVSEHDGFLRLIQPLSGQRRLTLTASRDSVDRDLARLLGLEAAGTAFVLLFAGALLTWLLGRALAPIDRTTAVARAIAAGATRERLAPDRTDTELGRMAEAFDLMLDTLDDALQRATASEAAMRQLLSDAAHELRTPIASLQTTAEGLLRENPPRAEREQRTVRMIRETTRAGQLVNDLLTLERLSHDPALERAEVDLPALARGELERAQLLAPEIGVNYDGPVRLIVRADRRRLEQLLTNLLDNARHATPSGGTITISISAVGQTVELAVNDTGPGIPDAERERIFDRFVRLDADRSRHRFGSGLGLAIARGIARAHGGELNARPCDAGARLVLQLPIHAVADARESEPSSVA